ncbi:MAG: glycosyltransferase family 39 protein [Alphaproteobacteria bacterium]
MALPAALPLFDQLARGWRAYLLLVLIALAAALPGIGRMPVMDRDEARFVQATRQMVETGDYVRIRLQNESRNKKPIGIYWLQAAAVEATAPITGRLNEVWAYRLPSVLGAVIAALATFWAGTALMTRRAAFLGAALFAAGMLIGAEGMTAKTDAMLTGCITLAMAALARLYVRDAPGENWGSRGLALVFWAAFAAGVLVKGPVTPIVVTLTLGALGLWEKRWAWMKPLLWPPGPILAALIIAPWMIAIGAATHGGFFRDAMESDLAPKVIEGQQGHFSPPGYYIALLSVLIFPATFALPGAARLGWRALRQPRASADPLRFLLAWAIPTFLAFEILPTKLAHYTLPTYPAIALLCGAATFVALREKWPLTRLTGIVLFAVAGAVLVALMAAGATFVPGDAAADLRRAIQAGLLGAGFVTAATAALVIARQPFSRAIAAILAALLISYTLREHVLPEARSLHISAEAVAALKRARLMPTDTRPLWVVGYRETSIIFLTRTDARLATASDASANARPGDVLVVEARSLPQVDAGLAARHLIFMRASAPVSGRNYGNGLAVSLYVGDVERAPAL